MESSSKRDITEDKVLVVVTSRNNATSRQAEDADVAEDATSRRCGKQKKQQAEDAAHKGRKVKVLMRFAIMTLRRSCVMAKVVEGCSFVRRAGKWGNIATS